MSEPSKPAETKKPEEANIARYNLSDNQNAEVTAYNLRIAAATAEVQKAEAAAEDARKLYEAKLETLAARRAAHDSEVENRTRFFDYIRREFKLPEAKKDGKLPWSPREPEPGKFALFAEVDEAIPATPVDPPSRPPTPIRAPKHEFKRRKTKAGAPLSTPPSKGDTNNPTEDSAPTTA